MSSAQVDERAPLLADERGKQPDAQSPREIDEDVPRSPVPWGLLFATWLASTTPGLAFEVIFPFISEMILHVGVTDDPSRVGFYSGLVESLFAVVQVITSLPAGWLADIAGRKFVVQLGGISVAVSSICFGFSTSFPQMLVARSLGGAMGGGWAALRTILSEAVDREHHGIAFSGLSLAYRTGQIVGLPLGGFLAHPARFGGVFNTPFWADKYPFALPCIVGGAFAILVVIFGQMFMKETLKNPWRPTLCARRREGKGSGQPADSDTTSSSSTPQRSVSFREALVPQAVHILTSNFFSVFLGGLGATTAQIGLHLSIRAAIHFAAMLCYPALDRRWGTRKVYQVSTAFWPLSVALLWLAGLCAKYYDNADSPVVWTILITQFSVWSVTSFSWTALGILVNDVAPFPEARSRLNAVMQLTITLPQSVAPACSTALFALSIKLAFLNGYMVWVILIVFSTLFTAHAFLSIKPPPSARRQ